MNHHRLFLAFGILLLGAHLISGTYYCVSTHKVLAIEKKNKIIVLDKMLRVALAIASMTQ